LIILSDIPSPLSLTLILILLSKCLMEIDIRGVTDCDRDSTASRALSMSSFNINLGKSFRLNPVFSARPSASRKSLYRGVLEGTLSFLTTTYLIISITYNAILTISVENLIDICLQAYSYYLKLPFLRHNHLNI